MCQHYCFMKFMTTLHRSLNKCLASCRQEALLRMRVGSKKLPLQYTLLFYSNLHLHFIFMWRGQHVPRCLFCISCPALLLVWTIGSVRIVDHGISSWPKWGLASRYWFPFKKQTKQSFFYSSSFGHVFIWTHNFATVNLYNNVKYLIAFSSLY